MMDLRTATNVRMPYYHYNREERHLGAILFHLLQKRQNLEAIIRLAGLSWEIDENNFGIYFEYAHLRDLWHLIGQYETRGPDGRPLHHSKCRTALDQVNEKKRSTLLKVLRPPLVSEATFALLEKTDDVKSFNRLFSAKNAVREILPPSQWRIDVMIEKMRADIRKLAEIKWAFNAKPDLVIHTNMDQALCLELKLESKEGKYTGDPMERRAIENVFGKDFKHGKQVEVQEFLMTTLLGVETKFIFVTRNSKENEWSWAQLFELFGDLSSFPPYIRAAIDRACTPING